MKGIILGNISNLYQIKEIKNNKIYEATARGKFKKEGFSPVVGDYVEIEITDEENGKSVINEILKRNVYVKRPKIANITQLVFVVSSKQPKPDLYMLDKQLALAEFLGIKSIIVLNKTDLDTKNEFKEIRQIYEKIGYKVLETEANKGKGVEALKKVLKNNINAFSGNSGVGKSTLINSIFNKNLTLEGEISKKNQRGKNTTTAIQLYEIDKNTYVADTPGFSTFSIEEIKSQDLANYFIEFKDKIQNCEFVGCTHVKELNCGIKEAIINGEIDKGRYERFCKIQAELKQKEEKKW